MGRKQRQRSRQKQKKKHRRHNKSYSDRSQQDSQERRNRKQKSRHKSKKHHHHGSEEDQDRQRERDKKRRSRQKQRKRNSSEESRHQTNNKVKIQKEVKHEYAQRYEGWDSSPEQSPQQQQAPKMQQHLKQQGQPNPDDPPKKQQPNFEPSGILLEYYNAREGVALKFHQPPQAHTPIEQWRIYPFKDNNPLSPILLQKSCYLIGKDPQICDILLQNSSISRQHAVLQFRSQYKPLLDGSYELQVKPYIMDLESTNGTLLNGEKIEPSRYVELLEKDVIKFGLSERDYVVFKVRSQK